jgi:hypothetical protein
MLPTSRSGHFREVCRDCNSVLSQCRCWSCDKTVIYKDGPCDSCKPKVSNVVARYVTAKDNNNLITPEMLEWFNFRTAQHIALVQKYSRIIEAYDPIRFRGLSQQTEMHDQSKFQEPELVPYIYLTWRYRCGEKGGQFDVPKEMENLIHEATLHHVRSNPHHPEYMCLDSEANLVNKSDRDKPPKNAIDATKMSVRNIAEMAADWMAVSEEKGTNPKEWAADNIGKRWIFNPMQINLIYELLNLYIDK